MDWERERESEIEIITRMKKIKLFTSKQPKCSWWWWWWRRRRRNSFSNLLQNQKKTDVYNTPMFITSLKPAINWITSNHLNRKNKKKNLSLSTSKFQKENNISKEKLTKIIEQINYIHKTNKIFSTHSTHDKPSYTTHTER